MPIITLTSDWNNNDYYVAALKGLILSSCPDVNIVDISHKIQTFSISQASFVVKHSFRKFPDGTVHIMAVNTEPGTNKPHIAVKAMNHFFIGCDNGMFMLLLDDNPFEAVALQNKEKPGLYNAAFDVFAKAACELANGKPISELGKEYKAFNRQVAMLPAIDESVINGSVIYIDSYRNAITNITEELFEKIRKKRRFEIFIQSNHYKVDRINRYYSETSVGELLALFNSAGCLEIAINNGNAADLLNLSVGSVVRIKFYG